MRTTVTLEEDVAAGLRRMMRERGLSFKEAINTALRAGLGGTAEPKPYETPSRPMGVRGGVDLDRALRLAAALEDEEIARELDLGK